MKTIEYKITFELENNEDWEYGSNKEFVLADCLCSLIDQNKSYKNGEEFKDEDRDFCLAKVKKHIGKFDLEAREVNK